MSVVSTQSCSAYCVISEPQGLLPTSVEKVQFWTVLKNGEKASRKITSCIIAVKGNKGILALIVVWNKKARKTRSMRKQNELVPNRVDWNLTEAEGVR